MYWALGVAGLFVLLAILGAIIPVIGKIIVGIIEAIFTSFDN